MNLPHCIATKRVYEEPTSEDGKRVLVDRIWPRGMTRERAAVALWLKEAGPSHDLRRWFGHQPERWAEFCERYHDELKANPEVVTVLLALSQRGPVTLVYSARDEQHNQAVALRGFLERALESPGCSRAGREAPH